MNQPPSYSSAVLDHPHDTSATLPQCRLSRHLPQSPYDHERYTPSPSTSDDKNKRSLDFIQRLEKKLAEYNASQNVFKRWLFEIVSWIVSAACMGAVIGIYKFINGKEMAQSERLLTVASLLGKVASASLIVPTSEALGQLKWHWFHQSKAMWDFEVFDKASRGAWGATLLLFRTKGRSLAALGALLIVLLLAIDTFFQQVVTYPDRWALQDLSGSIPRVVSYQPRYFKQIYQGFEVQQFDNAMLPVVKPYFFDNGTTPIPFGNATKANIPLSCPSSVCTWPAYETLAVCSQCIDASDLLQFACRYTAIDWTTNHTGPISPETTANGTVCGYFLNLQSETPILMSGYILEGTGNRTSPGEVLMVRTYPFTDMNTKKPIMGGSIKFKHIRNPILDALIVSTANGTAGVLNHERPVAHECALSWCVKTISSSYDGGKYTENITSIYMNTTTGSFPWESVPVELEDGTTATFAMYAQNITIERDAAHRDHSLTVSNATYRVDNTSASNMIMPFDQIFPSYFTDFGPSGKPLLRFLDGYDGPTFREMDFNPWLAPNNITRHLERLAAAMTGAMRSNADSNEMIPGRAYNMEKFIHISWLWLIFPILLLVLSLVFLVATIVKTSKDIDTGIWKTSAMPALIYSLPNDLQQGLATSVTSRSKKVRIKLMPKQGWRVSGQVQPASTAPPGFI
ncbi:hypothetical protein AALT_g573 [Alternaria alternata]|nr:hypothetical protein AALT_g573 [Alternaria alternata]